MNKFLPNFIFYKIGPCRGKLVIYQNVLRMNETNVMHFKKKLFGLSVEVSPKWQILHAIISIDALTERWNDENTPIS